MLITNKTSALIKIFFLFHHSFAKTIQIILQMIAKICLQALNKETFFVNGAVMLWLMSIGQMTLAEKENW